MTSHNKELIKKLKASLNAWMEGEEFEKHVSAFVVSIASLIVALIILLIGKHVAQISDTAALIFLLLLPVLVYLLVLGKLGSLDLQFGNLHVKTVLNRLDEVDENLQHDPERNAYLGKLRHVLKKDPLERKGYPYLLYVDVKGLRKITSTLYWTRYEKSERSHPINDKNAAERKSEPEYRKDIIRLLGFSLADALYETAVAKSEEKPKYEIYFLAQPDIVLILRGVAQGFVDDTIQSCSKLFLKRVQDYIKDTLGEDLTAEEDDIKTPSFYYEVLDTLEVKEEERVPMKLHKKALEELEK